MVHLRFTGAEDLALIEIVKAQKRVSWTKVVKQLEERGFPKRTAKSVRNRHLRWRRAQSGASVSCKNFCRKCGKLMRGHVCEIIEEGPTAASEAEGKE